MDDKSEGANNREGAEVTVVQLISASNNNGKREEETLVGIKPNAEDSSRDPLQPRFRLYRRRYAGVLGVVVLNIIAGMNAPWFGPITNKTAETFGISRAEVNWLGNIIPCTNIAFSPFVPFISKRFGLRISYAIGSTILLLSAWIRYAGTARSLDTRSAYGLLILGQLLSAFPQILFQVLAPKFSETWFDLRGRTTATMLMSVANPVAAGLGQLVSPMVDDVRDSILLLAILSTAVTPITLLIGARPPTPPSYSGSRPSPHFFTTLRAIFGLLQPPRSDASDDETSPPEADKYEEENTPKGVCVYEDAYMTLRERVDFVILTLVFSVLVSGVNTFSILSNEILAPHGYSEDTAGLMGAALLLSGIVSTFVTSPLFDRVLTHHLGLSTRIAVPIIAAAWLSLIWAVRPNNTGALYAIFVIIGMFSVSMLPVALELGCELTRNSDASSAILWWGANIATIVLTLVMPKLRAPSDASPPLHMRRSLIYLSGCICGGAVFILFFRGEQRRRQKDARVAAEVAHDQISAGGDDPDVEHGRTGGVRKRPFRFLRKKEGEKEQEDPGSRAN